MVWNKDSFEGLSQATSTASADDDVPVMVPSFVQAPDQEDAAKDNSFSPAPILGDDDSAGEFSVTTNKEANKSGFGCDTTGTVACKKSDAVAASNLPNRGAMSAPAPQLRPCSHSLDDWCAANRLSTKLLTALQDVGADSFDDLMDLNECERREMVEETGLRFVEKKKLLKALNSIALNAYQTCLLDSRSIAEYKQQLDADWNRANHVEDASEWWDDLDTKPAASSPVETKEKLEVEMEFQKNSVTDSDLDALEAQASQEDAVLPPVKRHLIQVPLVDENKRDGQWKTIVMLGETGTGKSTTLNSMVNYLFGVQYKDRHRYVLIRDANKDQSQSVTNQVTAYHVKPINCKVPYGVTLVDGPGFNDTGGLSRDEQIWKQYQKYFSEDLSDLDAVCFTMRATCGRFTPSQRYVYGKILSLFGNDINANLFMLLTFCDGKTPPAIHAIKAADFPCVGRCIKLNNSAFFNGFEKLLEGNDSEIEGEGKEDNLVGGVDVSRAFWEVGYQAMDFFFTEALLTAPKTSLTLTREVLREREHLEMLVSALNQRIREGLDTLESIRRTVHQVKKHQTDLDAHADFKISVSKPKVEKIDLQGKGIHTTTCLTCNYTCHDRCIFPNDDDKARCTAMSDGQCRVCPAKCHWSDHSNLPFWYKHSTVTVQEVMLSKKAAAEAAASGISNTESILREQRDKYLKQKMNVMNDIIAVHGTINRLRIIALRKDMLDADDHFQAMIDSELSTRREGYQARVDAIRSVQEESKLLREFCDGHTDQRVVSMDQALNNVDRDIKIASEKYEKSMRKVRANSGKANFWNLSHYFWSDR